MTELRHCVIGTAGHVDHGKTALVKALTGVDCDRLQEEKRRGITIALGFATWPLRPDLSVSVVDVPGHERFVNTMVSGASGLDAVMLVVAADDGVMPQTLEHLQICELLGVQRGVTVISKADLADEETLELIREDVRESVAGTFLEEMPVVVCSAASGTGLDAVREAVMAQLDAAAQRRTQGPAFLPIDRAFSKAGFGTVATGTLLTGRLKVGDSVEVIPGPRGDGRPGLRIRGLQIQEQAVDAAASGVRLATNLRGPQVEDVRRGEVVVAEGSQRATQALHVELSMLTSAPAVEEWGELSLHLGAATALVQVAPLGAKRIAPGTKALARLVSEQPVAAYAGQRFVVRQPGRHGLGTVGGGRVLDPHPAAGKGSFQRWARVAEALTQTSLLERIAALLEDAREAGLSAQELAQRLAPDEDIEAALMSLEAAGRTAALEVGGGRRFVDAERVDAVGVRVLQLVQSFHGEHPVLAGVSPAELKSQLPAPAEWLAEAAVARLVETGALQRHGNVVARSDRRPLDAKSAAAVEQVLACYRAAELKPPLDDEVRAQLELDLGLFRDVVNELKRRGDLARLADGLHFAGSALQLLRQRVEQHFVDAEELSPAQLKEMGGGLSRKWAIPLLEWLDGEGVTIRRGDVRVARKR